MSRNRKKKPGNKNQLFRQTKTPCSARPDWNGEIPPGGHLTKNPV